MKLLPMMLSLISVAGTSVNASTYHPLVTSHVAVVMEPIETDIASCREVLQNIFHKHSQVIKQYDALTHTLKQTYASRHGVAEADVHRMIKAIEFAARKHQLDVRGADTPYITHPLAVANILLTVGREHDPDVIIAAILQGTVEKTETTFRELEREFGTHVAMLVRELTENRSVPKKVRDQLEIAHAAKLSKGAAEVKLASKIDDLSFSFRSLPTGWKKVDLDAYVSEAQAVIDHLPLVNMHLKETADAMIRDYQENHYRTLK